MVDWFTHVHWAQPWFLLLLLAVPWLIWKSESRRDQWSSGLKFSSIMHFSKEETMRVKLYKYAPWLHYLSLVCFILAMARPQFILREEKINAEGIDIFMVMDLSSSMLSQDFNPNRLEVSKAVAIEFIQERRYDRIGIVGFSGEGFTQCPLTVDQTVLIRLMNELQCGYLEDGTAIGMGLATAINRLKNDSLTSSKVIILLTDGVNNAGDITPQTAAELAKTYNIKIYSIGVGTQGESYSPIGRDPNGNFVFGMTPVNIDEGLLHQISKETGGKYYRATNKEQLKEIYGEIDQLEKTKLQIKTLKRYAEEYHWFLYIAGIFVLCAYVIRYSMNPIVKHYV